MKKSDFKTFRLYDGSKVKIKTSEIMKDFVEFSPTEKLMFDLGNLTCFDAIGAVRKLPRID